MGPAVHVYPVHEEVTVTAVIESPKKVDTSLHIYPTLEQEQRKKFLRLA